MALIGLHTTDRWIIGGLRMDTPGCFISHLDGLRATSNVRVTGTQVPGRHGLSTRPHLDTVSEAIITAGITVTDRHPETGVQIGTPEQRRLQFERNFAAVIGAVSATGRTAAIEQIDGSGVSWSAQFRTERSPRVAHDRMGLNATVEVELVIPGGFLMGPLKTLESVTTGIQQLPTAWGATGPIFDLRVDIPSATPRTISDPGGTGRCQLTGSSGHWIFDNLAGTSTLNGVSNLQNIRSTETGYFLTLHPIPTASTGKPLYRISGVGVGEITWRESKAI